MVIQFFVAKSNLSISLLIHLAGLCSLSFLPPFIVFCCMLITPAISERCYSVEDLKIHYTEQSLSIRMQAELSGMLRG
jgi:hypothetical protein